MQGLNVLAAMLAGLAIVAWGTAAEAQAIRIQCSPARVEGTQCPPPSGICPDTTLGIGGNYQIDAARQSVTRYTYEWTQPQRIRVIRAAGGEVNTEESDRYFNAYVTMTFRLGDGRTPITYVHSIYPITGSNRTAPTSDRPTLRSEGTCVRVPQRR
jgi:hypothetical protein